MTSLKLSTDILPNKHTEFNQSWQTFIEHVRTNEGLTDFELKQTNQHCEITLQWKNKEYLNVFLENKWHAFIIGAIQVLGSKSTSVIE